MEGHKQAKQGWLLGGDGILKLWASGSLWASHKHIPESANYLLSLRGGTPGRAGLGGQRGSIQPAGTGWGWVKGGRQPNP